VASFPMKRPRLAILDDYEGMLGRAPSTDMLRKIVDVTVFDRPLDPGEIAGTLEDYQMVLAIRERTRFSADLLGSLPILELIVQTGGHAYHVDLEAATRQGVLVALGRRVKAPTRAVPELTFGLMLCLMRDLHGLTRSMARGEWRRSTGRVLHGRTLGILGLGPRHGAQVARLGRAFGMELVAWGPTLTEERAAAEGVKRLELDEVLSTADIVSIHLRLSEMSRGLLDRRRIGLMRAEAILINTARGAMVDELALAEALRDGRLAGAGLDVYADEPLASDSPLRRLSNVVLTPHIGWTVDATFDEFARIAYDQVRGYMQYALPEHETLNAEALAVEKPRSGGIDAHEASSSTLTAD
jgi:phosphoglycerate dehydrogenase-like enzyme